MHYTSAYSMDMHFFQHYWCILAGRYLPRSAIGQPGGFIGHSGADDRLTLIAFPSAEFRMHGEIFFRYRMCAIHHFKLVTMFDKIAKIGDVGTGRIPDY